MYNWIKAGILFVGMTIMPITETIAQTRQEISQVLHAEDNTTNTYSLADAIIEGLEKNAGPQIKILQIKNDSLGIIITKNDRRSVKLSSSGGTGYDPYPDIDRHVFGNTDNQLGKPYFELSLSIGIAVLNPDTKYKIAIAKTNGQNNMIGYEYEYTNLVSTIIKQYFGIQKTKKNIIEYKNEINLIDNLIEGIEDSLRIKKLTPLLQSQKIKVKQEQQKLDANLQSEITNFYKSLGKYSTAELNLTDTLFLVNPDLFESPSYDPNNKNFIIDSLAIPSAIIRTQSEQIIQKRLIYNLLLKSNVEFTLGFRLPIRNTVFPDKYFGTPAGMTFEFNLFGNSTKQRKAQALNLVLSYKLNINKQIINLAGNMTKSFNNLVSATNLCKPENRDAYKALFFDLLDELGKENTYSASETSTIGTNLVNLMDSHYQSLINYNNNMLSGINAATDVRSGVLFEEHPGKKADSIQENYIDFEHYLTGTGREGRKRFRELKKMLKKELRVDRKEMPHIPNLLETKGFGQYRPPQTKIQYNTPRGK